MHVIGGTASTDLAEKISRELGNAPFAVPFTKRFPDGELYLRVGGRFDGEDVIIVPAVPDDEAKTRFPKGFKALKPYLRVTPQPNK